MGDFISYQLSDFILFSQAVYYRQFELYNHDMWPLQIVAMFFSFAIIYALWKRPVLGGRFVAVLLVVSWLWVAFSFIYHRFYQIHVVADWYAFGFVLQAGLIAWYGVIKNQFILLDRDQSRVKVGIGLLLVAFLIYPFIAFITGRSWMQFEMFALAPDPTVLATLAILLFYKDRKALYVIPVIWVLLSAMTLFVMS